MLSPLTSSPNFFFLGSSPNIMSHQASTPGSIRFFTPSSTLSASDLVLACFPSSSSDNFGSTLGGTNSPSCAVSPASVTLQQSGNHDLNTFIDDDHSAPNNTTQQGSRWASPKAATTQENPTSAPPVKKSSTTEKKTKPSLKNLTKVNKDFIVDSERLWHVVYGSEGSSKSAACRKHHQSVFHRCSLNSDVSVTIKSRRTTSSIQLDSSLYSSIKYELNLDLKKDALVTLPEVFLAQIKVIEANQLTNVNPLIDGEDGIKSAKQSTLSRTSSGYSGRLKLNLNKKLSFHKLKTEFRLQIDFFLPNNLEESVLTLQSAAFKVFCRKPDSVLTKRRQTSKKRKRNSDDKLGFRVTKRGKIEDFQSRLHNLLCMVQYFPAEKHSECYEKIVEKLILNGDLNDSESVKAVRKQIHEYETRFLREDQMVNAMN